MHSVWISLMENLICSPRSNDISRPRKVMSSLARKPSKGRRYKTRDEDFCQGYNLEQFHELETSDIARNVVEKIFHSASMRKSRGRVGKILKVNNPPEMLERFEMYREEVKKAAGCLNKWDLRSTVDGNELLRFYSTTMTCCSKQETIVTQFCQDPACGVCRIIQSRFRAEAATRRVIQLSACSTELGDEGEDCSGDAKKQDVKKAVVLCRVIAGVVDVVENGGKLVQDCSSVGRSELTSSNPDGILPCFVIVYS